MSIIQNQSQLDGESSIRPFPDVRPPFLSTLLEHRIWVLGAVHLVLFGLAYLLAFLVRFDFDMPSEQMQLFWRTVPWIAALKLAVFIAGGQLSGWWRLITFRDLIRLSQAFVVCFLMTATINLFLLETRVPRSVLLLDSVAGLLIVGSLRSTWRLFHECVRPAFNSQDYQSALLIGTDDETAILAHQIQSYGRLPYRICGVLSVKSANGPRYIAGLSVLGRLDQLAEIASRKRIKDVLVMAGLLPGKDMRELMDTCNKTGLKLSIVPSFEDRMSGDGQVPIRAINIEDLLRRQPANLDLDQIQHLLKGRRILVTGAGGSIGSEICRQLIRFQPKSLMLLGRGENRIFQLERELLKPEGMQTELVPVIADIRDERRIMQVFEEFRPEIVFHTAAHKHVPLMEQNVGEAIQNNVLGTRIIADASHECGVQSFVLISTDKAVHPTSVMGATKRMAERYVQAHNTESSTRFIVVRFGNVLGSSGSVVPIFQDQIKHGGPITITHPDMTRFFMTIPEASQLVLQAAAMGKGGELFVLDMGTPVRIVDLAKDMIRLSGLPEGAIEIRHVGCRPGEKMHEELADDDDQIMETSHPKIRSVFTESRDLKDVREDFRLLEDRIYRKPSVSRNELRELILEISQSCEPAPASSEFAVVAMGRTEVKS